MDTLKTLGWIGSIRSGNNCIVEKSSTLKRHKSEGDGSQIFEGKVNV